MNKDLKQRVIALRKRGKTYAEICSLLKVKIPKGTLSCWCNNVPTPKTYMEKVRKLNALHLIMAREKSVEAAHELRQKQIEEIKVRNNHLLETVKDVDVAKIALAMLYLGEGTKNRKKGSVGFGNSDPKTISLFMEYMRNIYDIDESKFRCTLLCRADQDIKKLEKMWSETTKVPLSQFYKARIDPRTIGKPTKKTDYKGVCVINYFSAKVFAELLEIPKILAGL